MSTVVSALAMAVTRCPCTLSPSLWELACCTHLAWAEETDFDLNATQRDNTCLHYTVSVSHTPN